VVPIAARSTASCIYLHQVSVKCGVTGTNRTAAIFGIIYGDIEVASLIAYAGNGSSSTNVAHISEVATISSLQIPPVVVVGRLPVVA